jgi:opacity protein-like surface antigen
MKLVLNSTLILVVGFSSSTQAARAQQVNLYFGFGTAHDSSAGRQINTFGDGILYGTPEMGGLFTNFGVNVFITKQLGVGFERYWRTSQGDYAGLQYRPSFYHFDAIFQPAKVTSKRFSPEFRAGIGGASLHFSFDDQGACDQVPGCPSVRRFQTHLAAATRVYLTDHVFLRPALDIHHVNNFVQFGSNWAPQFSIGVGYGFGKE